MSCLTTQVWRMVFSLILKDTIKNLRCLVMFASIPFKLLIFVTFNLIFDEQVFFSNLILQYARDTCLSSIIKYPVPDVAKIILYILRLTLNNE